MIDHVWSVLCSKAIIDSDSNNVSIHDAVERIVIKAHPKPGGKLPIHLELVTSWVRHDFNQPAKGVFRVTYIMPSGKVAGAVEPPIDLTEAERARIRVIFEGLPVEEPGRHTFLVEKKGENDEWQMVASIPVKVIFAPEEEDDKSEERHVKIEKA
jgi:hypothetical protein